MMSTAPMRTIGLATFTAAALLLALLSGCVAKRNDQESPATDRLILAGYSVVGPVYQQEIIPLFQSHWRARTGREVVVDGTFASSGAQTRAVQGGYAADVVVLSLADEVDFLAAGGLIDHDWRDGPYRGFITRSLAAIAVRKGNPRNIRTWEDLTRPEVEVLMPSPKTSGGAMWCIAAIYAAGLLPDSSTVAGPADSAAAARLLAGIQHRVLVMDPSAHRAMESFQSGLGDALITYESEILWQSRIGEPLELVVPDRSLLIENPAAVVDRYAEAHGVAELAAEFVSFLASPEVQRALARFGLRPVDPAVLQEYRAQLPVPDRVYGIEELGGWKHVQERLFGSAGIWTRIVQQQEEP